MRRELPIVDFQYMNRKCGDCKACCTADGVEELGKPYFTPCLLLNDTGCSVHGKPAQPKSCRKFTCLWLDGEFEEADRPDKLGVIFQAIDDKGPWVEALMLRSEINGARVQELIEEVLQIIPRIRMIRFDQVMNTAYPIDEVNYPGMPNIGTGTTYYSKDNVIWFLKAPKREQNANVHSLQTKGKLPNPSSC